MNIDKLVDEENKKFGNAINKINNRVLEIQKDISSYYLEQKRYFFSDTLDQDGLNEWMWEFTRRNPSYIKEFLINNGELDESMTPIMTNLSEQLVQPFIDYLKDTKNKKGLSTEDLNILINEKLKKAQEFNQRMIKLKFGIESNSQHENIELNPRLENDRLTVYDILPRKIQKKNDKLIKLSKRISIYSISSAQYLTQFKYISDNIEGFSFSKIFINRLEQSYAASFSIKPTTFKDYDTDEYKTYCKDTTSSSYELSFITELGRYLKSSFPEEYEKVFFDIHNEIQSYLTYIILPENLIIDYLEGRLPDIYLDHLKTKITVQGVIQALPSIQDKTYLPEQERLPDPRNKECPLTFENYKPIEAFRPFLGEAFNVEPNHVYLKVNPNLLNGFISSWAKTEFDKVREFDCTSSDRKSLIETMMKNGFNIKTEDGKAKIEGNRESNLSSYKLNERAGKLSLALQVYDADIVMPEVKNKRRVLYKELKIEDRYRAVSGEKKKNIGDGRAEAFIGELLDLAKGLVNNPHSFNSIAWRDYGRMLEIPEGLSFEFLKESVDLKSIIESIDDLELNEQSEEA